MPKIESIVVVKGEFGSTATLRFDNRFLDRMFSSTTNERHHISMLYSSIEKYVNRVVYGKSTRS